MTRRLFLVSYPFLCGRLSSISRKLSLRSLIFWSSSSFCWDCSSVRSRPTLHRTATLKFKWVYTFFKKNQFFCKACNDVVKHLNCCPKNMYYMHVSYDSWIKPITSQSHLTVNVSVLTNKCYSYLYNICMKCCVKTKTKKQALSPCEAKYPWLWYCN